MKVRIESPLTHLCPFKEERDLGSVIIEYEPEGDPIELHWLATYLAKFADQTITHEELTQEMAQDLKARVVTKWRTAGLSVEVEADAASSGG